MSLSRIIQEERSHEIRVLTNDHDLGSQTTYPGIEHHQWNVVGRAQVGYLSMTLADWKWAAKQLRQHPPDAYYANSLQCPEFSLLPFLLRRLHLIPKALLIVAPRGECGAAAQAHKGLKKRLAKPLIRWLVGSNVVWHASSEAEADDIARWYQQPLPRGDRLIVRGDPAPPPAAAISTGSGAPRPTVVFASRIDHMKGLDIALDVMERVEGSCLFRVAGSVSDADYWQRCLRLARKLPNHVEFEYVGPDRPEMTLGIMSSADFLFLPTRGENFGHAIAEGLSVGCPVITSRETIWTDIVNSGGGNAGTADENLRFLNVSLAQDTDARLESRRETLSAYTKWYFTDVLHESFFTEALA